MRRILHLSLLSLSFLLLPTVCFAAPGSLLWQNYYNREGTLGDSADAVAVSGNRVFAVGQTETAAGGTAFTVRAYNYKGTPLWQNYYNREGSLRDEAAAVAVSGNRVFVVGHTATAAGGRAFTVRTYRATDGRLLWQNYYNREGTLADDAEGVAVSGNRVFVVGTTETAAGGLAFTVRTYNAVTGALLWQNYYDREGTLEDAANAVAVEGNRVSVVGHTSTAAGGSAFTVRTYRAVTGALLWQNYYDREGTLEDAANAVAAEGNKVFAVGLTGTAAGGSAFTVRAFQQ